MIRLLSTLALGVAITVPHVSAVNTCTTALPTIFTTQYITYETRSVLASSLPTSSLPTLLPPTETETEEGHEMNGMQAVAEEEVTTTESPTEIPIDATTTTTTPNEGTTDVPTEIPTEFPTTSPPTEQVMVDIEVPILHTTPFTPKMILYNPEHKTLFTRDTSGHLYYTSNISNSTAGFIAIPQCPPSLDPRPVDEQIYPEPAWDVYDRRNFLVYTCMEFKVTPTATPTPTPKKIKNQVVKPIFTTTSTLNLYDAITRQIISFNLTEYCDILKPTLITVDQKNPTIYITCTSPAPTSCTNIWRLTGDGVFTQVVDALECPNPRDVRVYDGSIVASCYDPDVMNEQTGIRGFGWVTMIDFNRGGKIVPLTTSACTNPSQIYYTGQYVYTHCADGTIIGIDTYPYFFNPDEAAYFRNTTIFNSSKHCPPSTSLTSFHINSGLDTLYATCTDIRLIDPTYAFNPKFSNTPIKTTIIRSRVQYEKNRDREFYDRRTFTLGSSCVPTSQSTHYNIAPDQTPDLRQDENRKDGALFVVCLSPDSNPDSGIITLYRDPVRTIPMKVGTSAQSIHVGNMDNNGEANSNSITPTDVMVPSASSSSSSSSKPIMGMSVSAGVSVIIFAIIVPIITLMVIIGIYMRRRKSNVRSLNNRMEPVITPNPALAVDQQV